MNVLRSLLTQLDEVKKERETLEGEIKAVTFDMSTTFLKALAQDGAINEEQLSLAHLDQSYGSYNQKVSTSLSKQEELLGQVQVHVEDVAFASRFSCLHYSLLAVGICKTKQKNYM